MDNNVLKMLQDQVNQEIYSAYLYMSMSSWFSDNSYQGFEKWMRVQVQEELAHAAYFMNYIQDRNQSLTFEAIAKPNSEWKNPLNIFEVSYTHECGITKSITDIFVASRNIGDIKSETFLQWFISEQIEEEKTVSDIIGRLKIAGDSSNALLMLDKEYGTKIFTMAANITF